MHKGQSSNMKHTKRRYKANNTGSEAVILIFRQYQEGQLVGYQQATNNYCIYQKQTGSITISRDVIFANTEFNSEQNRQG